MVQKGIGALIKFGEQFYMERLIEHGELYMRPLSAFKNMEEKEKTLRKDKNEALSRSEAVHGATLSVEIDGEWKPIGKIEGALRFRDTSIENVNVFCTHIIIEDRCYQSPHELVDPQNFEFGDTFVIIKDIHEFLKRVQSAGDTNNFSIDARAIEYVNQNTFRGNMGPFRKYDEYSFQSEYRITLQPGRGEPYKLKIGSLRDIALLGKTKEINQHLLWKDNCLF